MSGVSAVGDGGGEDEAPGGGIMGDECYYQIQTHACFFVYYVILLKAPPSL